MSTLLQSSVSGPRLAIKNSFLEYVGFASSPRRKMRTLTDSELEVSLQTIPEIRSAPDMMRVEKTDSKMSPYLRPTGVEEVFLSPAHSPWRGPVNLEIVDAPYFEYLPPVSNWNSQSECWWSQGGAETLLEVAEWNQGEYVDPSSSIDCSFGAGNMFATQPLQGLPEEGELVSGSKERVHFDQLLSRAFGTDEFAPCLTTVMLRNLPADFTRAMLLKLIDAEGFDCRYDFAYVPVDFSSGNGLGYAFVNLITPEDANEFFEHFDGFSEWEQDSDCVCSARWGEPCQGLEQHVDRYRNSPVMHCSVPDDWKPIVLVDGDRVDFPAPTKHIKAPKLRTSKATAASKTGRDGGANF